MEVRAAVPPEKEKEICQYNWLHWDLKLYLEYCPCTSKCGKQLFYAMLISVIAKPLFDSGFHLDTFCIVKNSGSFPRINSLYMCSHKKHKLFITKFSWALYPHPIYTLWGLNAASCSGSDCIPLQVVRNSRHTGLREAMLRHCFFSPKCQSLQILDKLYFIQWQSAMCTMPKKNTSCFQEFHQL